MRVLISGASIAGPVLAYWLSRYGFDVTVVERAPTLRKTGGHAVDLVGPAVEIAARMGVLPRIQALATGTERLTVHRPGKRRPTQIDLTKISGAVSDRHVEIMRDDLSEVFYDVGRNDTEYLFGDSITAIAPDGSVEFQHGPPRRFDLVVGADGLHSNVRRLVFGEEARFTDFIGAYLAVLSAPKTLARDGESIGHIDVDRATTMYTAQHLDDARAVFLFRSETELDYHHRDVKRQKEFLRNAFAGMHAQVDDWLAELDRTPAFYFDSVTQVQLDSWSRGRVTLVGDAGYCPGPAVGGSTSLAVIGAYVLAGELARAGGDPARAFAAYEREMIEPVRNSRAFARKAARTFVPRSRFGVWALANVGELLSVLPVGLTKLAARANAGGLRMFDAIPVRHYAADHD